MYKLEMNGARCSLVGSPQRIVILACLVIGEGGHEDGFARLGRIGMGDVHIFVGFGRVLVLAAVGEAISLAIDDVRRIVAVIRLGLFVKPGHGGSATGEKARGKQKTGKPCRQGLPRQEPHKGICRSLQLKPSGHFPLKMPHGGRLPLSEIGRVKASAAPSNQLGDYGVFLPWAAFFAALAAMAWAKKPGIFREDASKVVVAPKTSIREAIMLAVAALTVVCAFIMEYHAAAKHADFRFTEFWMTPQGAPNVLTIGIRNSEGEPTTYEVEATSGGLSAGRWLGISLKPGETWTEVFSTAFKPNDIQRVEAWLFKNNDHRSVYRRVWADIGRPAGGRL